MIGLLTVATARRTRLGRAMLILVLASLTMIGPFTIDTILPAFDAIGRDLAADDVAVQQTLSVYLVAFAVASLFHGSISDAVGRKPVIVVGCLLYVGASVLCALAATMPLLLAARGAQGLVAGAGMIVARTAVRDLYDGHQAQRFMSHIGLIFAVAPAVAPIVGGWILGWSTWRGIFWALAGYGLVLVAIAVFLLPETHPLQLRVDFRPGPLLRSFWATVTDVSVARLSGAMAFNFGGLFVYIAAAPAVVTDLLGLGEQDFGVVFVPLVAALMAGSFVTGRLAARVSHHRFVVTGLGIAVVGAAFAVGHAVVFPEPELPWAVVPVVTGALGVALAFPTLTVVAMDQRPRERGAVASVQTFTNSVVNAAIAGAVVPLVSGSLVTMGITGGAFTLLALACWLWHMRTSRVLVAESEVVAPDPSAQL